MTEIARSSGIAKATLYNHFRTKDDVLGAVLAARLASVVAAGLAIGAGEDLPGEPLGVLSPDLGSGIVAALTYAVEQFAASPQLRRIKADDPEVFARWAAPGTGQQWDVARTGIAALLDNAGSDSTASAVDLVLRWLLGHLAWKGTPEEVWLGARLLASGLSGDLVGDLLPARSGLAAALRSGPPVVTVALVRAEPERSGLGWPI